MQLPSETYTAAMSTGQKILIGYGVIVLTYGFLLGIPMAKARGTSPTAPRHLVNTHLSALITGPIHLALAAATAFVGFKSGIATVGAVLLVAGSILEVSGGTLNWLDKTGDQFAEKSKGFMLNATSGPVAVAGMAITAVGILANL